MGGGTCPGTVSYASFNAYNLYICFWLHWVFIAVCRLFSSCGEPGLLPSCISQGFSLRWLLLLLSTGSRALGLQWFRRVGSAVAAPSSSTGSIVVVNGLSCPVSRGMGLASLCHVESSWTRDRTRVPCIGRWILNHWTTGEVPHTS